MHSAIPDLERRREKVLWWIPIISVVLFLTGAWLFMAQGEAAFIIYALVYLAMGMTAMLIMAFVRTKVLKSESKLH